MCSPVLSRWCRSIRHHGTCLDLPACSCLQIIKCTRSPDDEKPEGGGDPSKGVPCNEQSREWRSCMLFPLKSTRSIPNLQRIRDQDLVILLSCQLVILSSVMSCSKEQPPTEDSYFCVAHLFLYERQSWTRGSFSRRQEG